MRAPQFFDRRIFDPDSNVEDRATLARLRSPGRQRLDRVLQGRIGDENKSVALRYVEKVDSVEGKGRVFIDVGCGESGDCCLVSGWGFLAHGIDLFPPRGAAIEGFPSFLKADAVEHIPLPDNSVDIAISQAVIDLVPPCDRRQLLQEVDRVLKPSGFFVCTLQWLSSGYGYDVAEEHQRFISVWDKAERHGSILFARKEDYS